MPKPIESKGRVPVTISRSPEHAKSVNEAYSKERTAKGKPLTYSYFVRLLEIGFLTLPRWQEDLKRLIQKHQEE